MPSRAAPPGLDVERGLLAEGCRAVAGVDEVGRGAWAGPVVVGAVVVGASTPPPPPGVRDSKELTPTRRAALLPAIDEWCVDAATGEASPEEVDRLGVVGALSLAGTRALAALRVDVDAVVLDGRHDYLSTLCASRLLVVPKVVTVVRGDRSCGSVAAASILAKVRRDGLMTRLGALEPSYDFASNKGYGTPRHATAVRLHGLSRHHRSTWAIVPHD